VNKALDKHEVSLRRDTMTGGECIGINGGEIGIVESRVKSGDGKGVFRERIWTVPHLLARG
jgi:hypothetical protein